LALWQTPPPGLRRASAPIISIGLLALSVSVLVVVTTSVQLRSQKLQRQITEAISPASTSSKDVEAAIALQMAALHAFARIRDDEYLRTYDAARQREKTSIARLESLMPRLQPRIRNRFNEFRVILREWHSSGVTDANISSLADRDRVAAVHHQQTLYYQTLAAVTMLQESLSDAAADRRSQIDASERIDWYVTIVVCLATLLAGFVLIWFDHRLRVLAHTAEERRIELQRLMEARAGLMRGLNHDIRNPLGAVEGYVYILKSGMRGELNPDQRGILTRIDRAVQSSLLLLQGVLELSQADAGKLIIHRQETDLVRLLTEVADDHRASVEIAGLSLETGIASSLPRIWTDATRVRRVVDNLLSNAVKYTPEGGTVTLSARVLENHGVNQTSVGIEVGDTGPGIPAVEQLRIFDEFYRIAGSQGQAKGLGVGLAISRTIARLLGGDLTVESTPGHGARFLFTVPLLHEDTDAISHDSGDDNQKGQHANTLPARVLL
jgi:signal transduction histidine kinase